MNENWICTDPDNNQYGKQLGPKLFEFKETDCWGETVQAQINLDDYSEQDKIECLDTYGYKWDEQNKIFISPTGEEIEDWIIAECLFEMRYFI